MKTLGRFAALFLVAGTVMAGSMFAGSATGAGASGAYITCEVPQNIVCSVASATGIKRVIVTVDFGGNIGDVNVVDQSYPSCPNGVNVGWDPIVPNYRFTVETCDGLKLLQGGAPSVHGGRVTGIVADPAPAPSRGCPEFACGNNGGMVAGMPFAVPVKK
jgi:hypothetical protein